MASKSSRPALSALVVAALCAQCNAGGLRGTSVVPSSGLPEQLVELAAEMDRAAAELGDGETVPWSKDFLMELEALMGDGSEGDDTAEISVSSEDDGVPTTLAPWLLPSDDDNDVGDVDNESFANDTLDFNSSDFQLESASQVGGGSCAQYGCVGYKQFHSCQCNDECSRHGNCCYDYYSKCNHHGGGRIVVERAWVALVAGQTDKPFPRMLCNVVKHFTKGFICHNGLIFQGTVSGRHGYFFLEFGNSGYTDVLTGKKGKWGLQIIPVAERFGGKNVLVRRLYGNDFSARVSRVVEQVRDIPYFLSAAAIARLLHRTNKCFSEHLMCSDFTSKVLVAMGCLRNDWASFNAQPTDFSSHAPDHQLHYTCGVSQDYWFDTRVR